MGFCPCHVPKTAEDPKTRRIFGSGRVSNDELRAMGTPSANPWHTKEQSHGEKLNRLSGSLRAKGSVEGSHSGCARLLKKHGVAAATRLSKELWFSCSWWQRWRSRVVRDRVSRPGPSVEARFTIQTWVPHCPSWVLYKISLEEHALARRVGAVF